mmetsp:Transcript_60499/g.100429  ORF Transcript_60499/g.100429 Transcript_60499/m.100429 type:complete len:463 (+) Transcript_60499:71-1459(+)
MDPIRASRPVDYYNGTGAAQTANLMLSKLASRSRLTRDSPKLILAMVGLPARGKSFISHKLAAFLSWSGLRVEIFNAGQNRRSQSAEQILVSHKSTGSQARAVSQASFFDTSNVAASKAREEIAMSTLDELFHWLEQGGDIAIFDATNSTLKRRRAVIERVEAESRNGHEVRIVFIESICDDASILEANMLAKVRASPDFATLTEAEALADLTERIINYEKAYESVQDEEGAYIKLYNLSSKATANQVFGRMTKSVLPFLTAIHIGVRSVYLAAVQPCGVNADPNFGSKLAHWLAESQAAGTPLRVLSSTKPAAMEAAMVVSKACGGDWDVIPGLNPLDDGRNNSCAGPEHLSRMAFEERFDGGESFADLVRRLEPCLLDLEASMDSVLVLSHGSPCRALRAYFMGCPVVACMGVASSAASMALAEESECIVELVPKVGGGWVETIHDLSDSDTSKDINSDK